LSLRRKASKIVAQERRRIGKGLRQSDELADVGINGTGHASRRIEQRRPLGFTGRLGELPDRSDYEQVKR
jgi:hypothetical protein